MYYGDHVDPQEDKNEKLRVLGDEIQRIEYLLTGKDWTALQSQMLRHSINCLMQLRQNILDG